MGTKGPSTMSTVSLRNREPFAWLEREKRPEVVDDSVDRGLRDTDQRT